MSKLIVVVDTQYDFMMPGGALYVPGAEKLIQPMIQYLYENKYNDIIATYDTHHLDTYFQHREYTEFKFPPHCIARTGGWANVLPIKEYRSAMWVKEEFDPWSNDNASREIEALYSGVPVEIIGVAADFCVKYAYEGFKQRGFDVKVIPELTVGIKENPYA